MPEYAYKKLVNQAPSATFMQGHRACSGCGPALTMRHVLETLGSDIVVVNATSCMEIVSTPYPESTWSVPYIHSLFENVPAVASGVSRAFKNLGKKGTVVGIGGDGSTFDIGFGSLSGAMERNEDMIYICYDNECYANTGVQRSGATPFSGATTTSPKEVGGKGEWKKNLPFIAAAHAVPYVATVSIGFLPDLKSKLLKAKAKTGFRFIHVHAPGPLEWAFDPSKTLEMARLAVKAGMWNLFEIEDGLFKRSFKPSPLAPLEDYIKNQGRFRHAKPEQIEAMKAHIIRAQDELDKLEKAQLNFEYFL